MRANLSCSCSRISALPEADLAHLAAGLHRRSRRLHIAVPEGLHLIPGREAYARISVFWTKIFAVSFAMGVVSSIIMPFQFGTNWSRFTDATANIISPMMA